MATQLVKGNEAVLKGAILAGCRSYYGYPITPASEIAEAAARYMPQVGGVFLQAESEVAAINMCYGASGAGERTMTASSSPGISLKQEGLSYAAGAELPLVVVNIMRGGPGLGNIAPEQGDYNQMVKGGGHGCYKVLVLAPNSCQEMCDLTMLAFDLADRYRNPVCILADGYVGQMMEPVNFPEPITHLPDRPWALDGTARTQDNLINSIFLKPEELERHVRHLEDKYREAAEHEVRFEEYHTEGARLVCVAYGVVSRILHTAIDQARAEGKKVGMLRPITLLPFPVKRLYQLSGEVAALGVFEMSTGQMVDDVRLAIQHRVPVEFYGRVGGMVPTVAELKQCIDTWYEALA
jgi:pyruvate/2-oxoacid:ferredoxin oxidoreductase alpha subunit